MDNQICEGGTCVQCDECGEGASRCTEAGQVQTCGYAPPGCMRWEEPTWCSGETTCTDTTCCADSCSNGDVMCVPDKDATRTCADHDYDGCQEWGPIHPCGGGDLCFGAGMCQPASECGPLSAVATSFPFNAAGYVVGGDDDVSLSNNGTCWAYGTYGTEDLVFALEAPVSGTYRITVKSPEPILVSVSEDCWWWCQDDAYDTSVVIDTELTKHETRFVILEGTSSYNLSIDKL